MADFVVGIDVGHSAVKIATDIKNIVIPSVVLPAFHISDETEAIRCAKESVTVNSKNFFYGESAMAQSAGDPVLGLNDAWLDTDQHEALVSASINELKKNNIELTADSIVVAGLPIKTFSESKALLASQFRKFTDAEIRVVPQPFGPFFYSMLDKEGNAIQGKEVTADSYCVIDIGFFTTDVIIMKKGRYNQAGSGGSDGVHIAAKYLKNLLVESKGIKTTLTNCEKALRTGIIDNKGRLDVSDLVIEAREHLAKIVIEIVKSSIGHQKLSWKPVRRAHPA
jgi:plasmid segregation protein ParM